MFVCLNDVFFFCKQKTAYEMRISDWSSDVCSSDLAASTNLLAEVDFRSLDADGDGVIGEQEAAKMPPLSEAFHRVDTDADKLISEKEFAIAQSGRASCRERRCQSVYSSVVAG